MTDHAKTPTPVLLAVPVRRFNPEDATSCLPVQVQDLMVLLANSDLPWKFELATFGGGNVSRGRNKIVATFLRGVWKWVVFLDDDILPDEDDPAKWAEAMAQSLFRILGHRKHVCGGLYTTKEENPHWVLNCFNEPEVDKDGLLRVGELGTGGMKTYHRSVFEALIQKEPDLAYVCDLSAGPEWGFFCQGLMTVDGRRRWLPEDYWMDQLCRKHGIPVFVDTTVKFRHLDVHTGKTYPLAQEWPRQPGPHKPVQPPVCAEELPDYSLENLTPTIPAVRLLICLQYWKGDRSAAMRLARYIADLVGDFHMGDVELRFVVRHDAQGPDADVMAAAGKKMQTSVRTVPRHEVGYPASPNYMAHDTILDAATRDDVEAVLLMESDCVPVHRNWMELLLDDWLRAKQAGKLVMGSWRPECSDVGHINGNMIFHPKLAERVELPACPPKKAWDVFWATRLSPVWCRTGLIANRYCEMYLDSETLAKPECGTLPPVLIHGVKDNSVWQHIQKIGLLK